MNRYQVSYYTLSDCHTTRDIDAETADEAVQIAQQDPSLDTTARIEVAYVGRLADPNKCRACGKALAVCDCIPFDSGCVGCEVYRDAEW